jgi:hypothetical protein
LIGATHQGASDHVLEAHIVCPLVIAPELIRRDVASNWKLPIRGLEVLTQGQHVALRAAQITERAEDLYDALSEPQHQA